MTKPTDYKKEIDEILDKHILFSEETGYDLPNQIVGLAADLNSLITRAFHDGQHDCIIGSNPINHKYFDEALNHSSLERR